MNLLTPDLPVLVLSLLLELLTLVAVSFALYSLLLLYRDKTWNTASKWIWAVVIVWLNFLGALLYVLLGRGKGKHVCKEDNLPVV